jgi:hypothetical protein
MTRMQFAPTRQQVEAIEAEVAASGRPVASVLREAVELWRLERDRAQKIDRALAIGGGYHSGLHDISERHDAYFVMGIEEEMRERWG